MAHYNITYTCGHTDRVNLIGPHRSRESRIAYLEGGPCFECYKAQRHEVARAQAEVMDLPALVGTEKQIAWAETIRVALLTAIDKAVEAYYGDRETQTYRLILQTVEVISNETSAKQWIEWRDYDPDRLVDVVFHQLMKAPTPAEQQAKIAEQQRTAEDKALVLAAATVRPEAPVTETVAEIRVSGNVISIVFPEKRDDFREVVKALRYAWQNGCWQRKIGTFAGTVADRVAEAGHTLLTKCFAIRMMDDVLRAAAVSGTYAPECTHWITAMVQGEHTGWFAITWAYGEDFYEVARKIKRSKYHEKKVVVPPEQFTQVLDFAQMYGFQLSEAAQAIVASAQAAKDVALVTQPVKRTAKPKAPVPGAVPEPLPVPETVEIALELQDH